MLKLLEGAATGISTGTPFAKKAGRLTITAGGDTGEKSLRLRLDADDATAPALQWVVDPTGAKQMARVLAQSRQVAVWFVQKLKPLQPEMILITH